MTHHLGMPPPVPVHYPANTYVPSTSIDVPLEFKQAYSAYQLVSESQHLSNIAARIRIPPGTLQVQGSNGQPIYLYPPPPSVASNVTAMPGLAAAGTVASGAPVTMVGPPPPGLDHPRTEIRKPKPAIRENSSAQNQLREVFYYGRSKRNASAARPAQVEPVLRRALSDDMATIRERHAAQFPRGTAPATFGFELEPVRRQPSTTVLQKEIARVFQHYLSHDHSVSAEIMNLTSYSDERKKALLEMEGTDFLADQYGLQTIRNLTELKNASDLGLLHEDSPIYHRGTANERFKELSLSLWKRKVKAGDRDIDEDLLVFVNSTEAVSRIRSHLRAKKREFDSQEMLSGGSSHGTSHWSSILRYAGEDDIVKQVPLLRQGMVAIQFRSERVARHARTHARWIGAEVSLFRVMHATQPQANGELEADTALDNTAALDNLLDPENPGGIPALARLATLFPENTVLGTISPLLSGLATLGNTYRDKAVFVHDPVIANVLQALQSLVPAFGAQVLMKDRNDGLFNLFQAIIEEINLIMLHLRPYQAADYKKLSDQLFADRIGPLAADLGDKISETYLFSCAMEAIQVCVEQSRILTSQQKVHMLSDQIGHNKPDYFETRFLVESRRAKVKDARAFICPLNPSTTRKTHTLDTTNDWNAGKIVQETEKLMGTGRFSAQNPMVLIVDCTIERPDGKTADNSRSEVADLLQALKPYIEDKKLVLMLPKSLQKYPALTAAKTMAADLRIVDGDPDRALQVTTGIGLKEENTAWFINPEMQLMSYFHEHAGPAELNMVDAAAKKGAFINEHCFGTSSISGFDAFEPGVPLLIIEHADKKVYFAPSPYEASKLWSLPIQEMVSAAFPERDSFGFLKSTRIDIEGSNVRLALGQESMGELIEKLYGPGWLIAASQEQKVMPLSRFEDQCRAMLNEAIAHVFRHVEASRWIPLVLGVMDISEKEMDYDDVTQLSALHKEYAMLMGKHSAVTRKVMSAADQKEAESKLATQVQELWRSVEENTITSYNQDRDEISFRLTLMSALLRPVISGSSPELLPLEHSQPLAMLRSVSEPYLPGLDENTADSAYADVRYLPNRLCSILRMADICLKHAPAQSLDSRNRTYFNLLTLVLKVNLPGISQAGKSELLHNWCHVNKITEFGDDYADMLERANTLISFAHYAASSGEKAIIFEHFNSSHFALFGKRLQRRMVEAFVAPLDPESRQALHSRLAVRRDDDKLMACADQLSASYSSNTASGAKTTPVMALHLPVDETAMHSLDMKAQREMLRQNGYLKEIDFSKLKSVELPDVAYRVDLVGLLQVPAQRLRSQSGKRMAYQINDAAAFSMALATARSLHKYGDCVDHHLASHYLEKTIRIRKPDGEVANMAVPAAKLLVSTDGLVAGAVSADGELKSVFSMPGRGSGMLAQVMESAIQVGARHAIAYNTGLVEIYAKFGFHPIARVKTQHEISDQPQYQKFNGARPDDYFLIYDPHRRVTGDEPPYVEHHGEGIRVQRTALNTLAQMARNPVMAVDTQAA